MESCEFCMAEERLKNAIVNGELVRICQRCVIANSAVPVEPPSKQQLAESMMPKRRQSEQKVFPAKKEFTLDDLRRISKEKQEAKTELTNLGIEIKDDRQNPWRYRRGANIDFRSGNLTIADLKIKKERLDSESETEAVENTNENEKNAAGDTSK